MRDMRGTGEKAGSVSADPEPVTSPLLPMEAQLVEALPEEPGWQFEPKWDGFRCLAFRAGDDVELLAKSGKPLGRYFPEIVAAVRSLPGARLRPRRRARHSASARRSPSMRCRCGCIPPRAASASSPPKRRPSSSCSICLMARRREPARRAADRAARRAGGVLRRRGRRRPGSASRPARATGARRERWLQKAGGALDGVIAKRLDGATSPASAPC